MKSLSWRRKPRCQSVSGCKADIRAASSSCRSSSSPFFARPSFCDRSGEYRDANTTANVRQDYQSARTKRKTPPERENRHCWRSRRSSYFERESVQQRQLSSLVHYERNRKSNKKSAKVKEKKSVAIFKKFALIVTDHKITMSKKSEWKMHMNWSTWNGNCYSRLRRRGDDEEATRSQLHSHNRENAVTIRRHCHWTALIFATARGGRINLHSSHRLLQLSGECDLAPISANVHVHRYTRHN